MCNPRTIQGTPPLDAERVAPQCDQALLVWKEGSNAVATEIQSVVQRVKVPPNQNVAGGLAASLAGSSVTTASMRRRASE